MIRLIGTELTRLRWRRAVIALIAAAVVVPLLIAVGTAWETRPYSEAEIARAHEQAQAQPGFAREVRRCEKHPRRSGVRVASECEEQLTEWWSGLYREPLDLRSQLHNSSIGVAAVLLALLVLVGTTFAGADWASGSMSNQLLFEPRRLRVWLAKGIAVGLVATLLAAVMMTLYWGALYGIAASRSIDVPPGVTGEVAWQIGRCAFLAAVGATVGYAITMLSRSTVFTLGTVFAVSVAGSAFVAALPLGEDKERWFPATNLLAVLQGWAPYYRPPPAECAMQGADPAAWDSAMRLACNGQGVVTVWQGLVFVLVPACLVVVLSAWSFRRRDLP